MWRLCLLLISSLVLLSCSLFQPPLETRSSQYHSRQEWHKADLQSIENILRIDDSVVLVDSRTPFFYQSSHLENAVSLRWDEFTDRKQDRKSYLVEDLFYHARRLSRKSIGLDTRVLVLGDSTEGKAEDLRLAWTLYYMGLSNIQVAKESKLSFKRSTGEEVDLPDVAIWKPQLRKDILCDLACFKQALKDPKVKILDVRSAQEYAKHSVDSLHIEWKEFFQADSGLLQLAMANKLKARGILPEQEIICVSNTGMRSSAACFALQMLGYKKARNYLGGWEEYAKKVH